MKRLLSLLLVLALALGLCACGLIEEEVEIYYGKSETLENEKFDKYDEIEWESENPAIVSVEDGVIFGEAPGETVVTASTFDKELAKYTMTVKLKEITSIVLSTNNLELTEGDTASVSYSLFPEDASVYGLTWRSADESVATVDENGQIQALAPGQTTITLSTESGVVSAVAVTVNLKPAYDRLNEKELALTDALLGVVNRFKNPNSVKVLAVEAFTDQIWYVSISATNSYGGRNSKVYMLWSGAIYEADHTVKSSEGYDVELINEALAEKVP